VKRGRTNRNSLLQFLQAGAISMTTFMTPIVFRFRERAASKPRASASFSDSAHLDRTLVVVQHQRRPAPEHEGLRARRASVADELATAFEVLERPSRSPPVQPDVAEPDLRFRGVFDLAGPKQALDASVSKASSSAASSTRGSGVREQELGALLGVNGPELERRLVEPRRGRVGAERQCSITSIAGGQTPAFGKRWWLLFAGGAEQVERDQVVVREHLGGSSGRPSASIHAAARSCRSARPLRGICP
jgi:hypothetical protein